ncbi:hypothetical protein GCK72_021764 [Caenorhabditis remanei]|uniref:BTB domain-containing protein n=1 Tax=Caenorhabditis remanei TaxID=31234 RepID=A0A6A5GKZ1_CAERE|nr:hypothetical protein GCK72_021764 [Caenorhabditis remanei]KAF1755195.1 hypothetical protein GCK72_021764 [Caenorhabditis remanei]
MARTKIGYTSGTYRMNVGSELLESGSNNGIECIWTRTLYDHRIIFKWKFNWIELKNQGVHKITGYITLFSANNSFRAMRRTVELTESKQEIEKEFECSNTETVYYTYSLSPCYTHIPENTVYDEMFAPSDQNDTILIVDGKKLHVSKAFLSYHSEYFRALFSSNYKEGQMDEIPIGEVSFKDFALLLSTFYPKPTFPSDETVEIILKMARRFLVTSAVSSAEHHLMNMSKIDNEKILWLADEYGMPNLLEKCIREMNTIAKAKKMKRSAEYDQLSDKTKLKMYERLVDSNSY